MDKFNKVNQQTDHCWIISDHLKRNLVSDPICVVQLGRFGDLLQLFPAFKLMSERDGMRPVVMVSKEFSNVFDGISYALPWEVSMGWWNDTSKAKRQAQVKFNRVIVPQYWNDVDGVQESESRRTKLKFTAHGRSWDVEGETPDYGTCMWNRLGFTRSQMISTPLVLDRRSPTREEALVKNHLTSSKPLLIYNFTGHCSPFPYTPEMMRLLSDYRSHFNLVDLGEIRAHHIYDLLGFYDRAVGLITSDTATAHLAPASKVPAIWMTVDTTGTSVPKGNVALHVKYSEVPKRLQEIRNTIESWKP